MDVNLPLREGGRNYRKARGWNSLNLIERFIRLALSNVVFPNASIIRYNDNRATLMTSSVICDELQSR